MANISELVWLYIKRRPFLREMIREGVINYSALARKISDEILDDPKLVNAVKMALVRQSRRMAEKEGSLEEKIKAVLRKSSLTVRSKVAVVVSTKELEAIDTLSYVESRGIITYVVDEAALPDIRKSRFILRVESNLNLISIHSPVELESTPGVISNILASLSGEGINVAEFVSCYTDTLLVVNQADTTRAYEILNGLMR